MLVFIDQDEHVRILRADTSGGVSSRASVGRVMKNRLEMTDDLRTKLSVEEAESVAEMIEIYKNAAISRAEYYSLNFPEIAREVMDRFELTSSAIERQLIANALMEAVRRMRKFERENQPA